MKNYDEYTYEIAGDVWEKGKPYKMVIITHWSDRTEKAKEIGRKVFYFDTSVSDIHNFFRNENQVREIYFKYPQYKRLALRCA